MTIPKTLSDLSQYFDYFEFESEDTPVIASVVAPNSTAFNRWPAFPPAATPEYFRVANGRGLTRERCKTSGLGEAVELASCCAWNDEDVFKASLEELGPQAWSPCHLSGFSEAQMASRDIWNEHNSEFDWRPAPVSPTQKIDWMWAAEPDQESPVAVPADFALIGCRDAGDAHAVAIGDSNGCASGPSIKDAKLSALLELIERDATGRWWYRGQACRRLPLECLEAQPDFLSAIRNRSRSTALFDITTDIFIPTVAAVSWDDDGTGLALGFSAALSLTDAALSAAIEMAQIELTIRSARGAESLPSHLENWMRLNAAELPMLAGTDISSDWRPEPLPAENDALDWAMHQCAKASCRLAFIDLTRTEFGVPTVRAIAPELCHYKPRFGKARSVRPEPVEADLVLLSI